jgi:hypothetical protein
MQALYSPPQMHTPHATMKNTVGLYGPGSIPGSARVSLLHSVQTASGAHPAFYPMGTGGKAAGA